jgi:hypothetical protein
MTPQKDVSDGSDAFDADILPFIRILPIECYPTIDNWVPHRFVSEEEQKEKEESKQGTSDELHGDALLALNLMIQDSELLEQLKPEDEEDFYY